MYATAGYAETDGLMFYGPSQSDLHRRAAVYVDKILKGTKPADLPVEQPTKFEFIINLKAAKQIGLDDPTRCASRGRPKSFGEYGTRPWPTEAGSHRASGHRIRDAPLTEYQMSPFAPARDIRWRVEWLSSAPVPSACRV